MLLIHRWLELVKQLYVNDRFGCCRSRFDIVARGHCGVYISVNISQCLSVHKQLFRDHLEYVL